MTRTISLNGKFLAQKATGVQRVATEFVRALDELASEGEAWPRELRLELLHPRSTKETLPLRSVIQTPVGRRAGVLWEQTELPRRAGASLLVNFGNIGPLSRTGDIVFIHDAQPFISPQSYSRAFGLWYRTALPIMGRRASRVLTVSEYAARTLVEAGVADPSKLSVIRNGVDHLGRIPSDPGVLHRLGLGARPFVVAPATAQRHKNLSVLMEAFHHPALDDLDVVLVGSASREEMGDGGAAPPERAILAGRLSDSEMRGLIENALAFAFPSTTEGFGLPPLEAMFLGTAAVVAPCGALPELCGDAVLYADPHDASAWVAALRRLADDPQERHRKIEAGRAKARLYRWRDSAQALVRIIIAEAGAVGVGAERLRGGPPAMATDEAFAS